MRFLEWLRRWFPRRSRYVSDHWLTVCAQELGKQGIDQSSIRQWPIQKQERE